MKSQKVIIVEDEPGAANNLQSLLHEVAPHIQVLAILASIEEVVEWLKSHVHPDLAFFDIQLEDGLSFEIFRRTEIRFPVIFTTAFDQYAITAFKVNSIDYLLKPIREEDILFSFQKYEQLNKSNVEKEIVSRILESLPAKETTSFLVHYKDKLIPVSVAEFAFFCIEHGLVYGYTLKHQKYPLDYTLEELEEALSNTHFFRANRQYIINRKAIRDIEIYFNGRLLINLISSPPEPVLISKARVPVFKSWIKGWDF